MLPRAQRVGVHSGAGAVIGWCPASRVRVESTSAQRHDRREERPGSELENAHRVAAQELQSHVVLERHLGHLFEAPAADERRAHRRDRLAHRRRGAGARWRATSLCEGGSMRRRRSTQRVVFAVEHGIEFYDSSAIGSDHGGGGASVEPARAANAKFARARVPGARVSASLASVCHRRPCADGSISQP